ncbi:MBOAT family protein [Steroidobacter sp. S1-65]|uniref:Probable alginate O-acetylase n=1 Tax=Steroidobacter gossypii TaxID=2805490 RepID=A0ABS1X6P4_9GAMM|nr:MBOAT family protein [Steroidobacter gossypii]MBM0108889.1 MBOAT family protein [Steroidobacter gossypii]
MIIESAPENHRVRLTAFIIGVLANIACLGYFKYTNFFLHTANSVLGTHLEAAHIIIPLGISFFVFQKIALLADAWSRQIQSLRLTEYLLFNFFFPKVIAGPIVHYNELVPQFETHRVSCPARELAIGLCLFSLGLFKKCVISDGVGVFAPAAFDFAGEGYPPLLTAWTSILAYTLQIYFDFSGYSDMALGTARMLGVRLPMNFNSPYKAVSIVDFWNRWHISLTRFLTAYSYTPLVVNLSRRRLLEGKPVLEGKGSALSAIWTLIAIPSVLTMALSGLWHGPAWTFVAWGVLHGIYLTVNQAWRILRPRFWPNNLVYERVMGPVGWLLTFLAVSVSFVFFRAPSLESAFSVLGGLFGLNGAQAPVLRTLQMTGADDLGLSVTLRAYWEAYGFSTVCIVGLLTVVVMMPNSLEILSRYQPALDFTEESLPPLTSKPTSIGRALLQGGAPLSYATAVVMALLFSAGFLALTGSSRFLYGQF